MLGLNAMPMAPTITGVPDIVVGSLHGSSDANVFVYPGAITLQATDDSTTSSAIIWTYTVADPTSPRYNINGHDPVDLSSVNANDDPNNPTGTKRIDAAFAQSEVTTTSNTSNDPHIATVRDRTLSPFPVQASYSYSGPTGIVGSEVLTLIASDGTTYSIDNGGTGTNSFIVYSDKGGVNRISGNSGVVEFTHSLTGASGSQGPFVTDFPGGGASQATFSYSTVSGACMQTPTGGTNKYYAGYWSLPYGNVPLTKNQVYRIRMHVTGTSTTPGTTPMWTMMIDNTNSAFSHGKYAYYGQYYNLDNQGGASAAASYGRGTAPFLFYYAPLQVQMPAWNDSSTGAFTSNYAADKDFRVTFRVLDTGSNLLAQNRSGTLCLTDMEIKSFDVGSVSRLQSYYNAQATDASASGAMSVRKQGNATGLASTITFDATNHYLTLAPSGNWGLLVDDVTPGTQTGIGLEGPIPVDSTVYTHWPIPWNSDELLMFEAQVSAPQSSDTVAPPPWIALKYDTPSYESFGESFVTATGYLGMLGMPKTGAPQTYTSFLYTHNKTTTPNLPFWGQFRPMFEIEANPAAPEQNTLNGPFIFTTTGAVRLHNLAVTKVTFNDAPLQ